MEGALKRRCTKLKTSRSAFSCGAAIVPQPLSMSSFFEEAYAERDADFLIRGVSDTSVDRPWQSSAHPLQLRR